MKPFLTWLNRLLWTVIVTVVVLVAIYVSAGRYYIDYLGDYKQQLIEQFTELTGISIEMETLAGKWSHFSPTFIVNKLGVINRAGETPIKSRFSSATVDVPNSLWMRTLLFSSLDVDGAEVELEQSAAGKWQLKGYESGGGDLELKALREFGENLRAFSLNQLTVALQFNSGEISRINFHEVQLVRQGDFRRLTANIRLNNDVDVLHFVFETKGEWNAEGDFDTSGYVELSNADVKPLAPLLASFGVELDSAQVNAAVWIEHERKKGWKVWGNSAVSEINIASILGREERYTLNKFDSQFSVIQKSNAQWELQLPETTLYWPDRQINVNDLIMSREGADMLVVKGKSLPLSTVNALLHEGRFLPAQTKKIITDLSPTGALENVNVSLPLQEGKLSDFVFSAELADVAIEPWQGAPGAKGLNGYIRVDKEGGTVDLDTDSLQLRFPGIYAKSLDFATVNAQVKWQISDNRVLVNSGLMTLSAQDQSAAGETLRALLSLNLPIDDAIEDSPKMDLVVGFRQLKTANRNNYIPEVVDGDLRKWLDASLNNGFAKQGAFIYRGSLRDNDDLNRSTQLYLNVEGVDLKYHSEWPKVEGVVGKVFVDEGDVTVLAERARVFDSTLHNLVAEAFDRNGGGHWLNLEADITGPAADALAILNQSPIREQTGETLTSWQLRGQLLSKLKLDIPLADQAADPEVQYQGDLTDGSLALPEQRLTFETLHGPIRYTSAMGLESSGLQARFNGRELTAIISPEKNAQGALANTVIDARSRLSMSHLQKWTGLDFLTFAKGVIPLQAQIRIPQTSESTEVTTLELRSNLSGMALSLPTPFNKTAKEKRDLTVKMPLEGVEDTRYLSIFATGWGVAAIRFQGDEYTGGIFNTDGQSLSESMPMPITDNTFTITGNVPVVNYENWMKVIDDYQTRFPSREDNTAESSGVMLRNLVAGKVEAFDKTFDETRVDIEEKSDGWHIGLDNALLNGKLIYASEQPLKVTLDRLTFPAATETTVEQDAAVTVVEVESAGLNGEQPSAEKSIPVEGDSGEVLPQESVSAPDSEPSLLSQLDPRELYDADIILKNVFKGEKLLGQFSFSLRSNERGLVLSNFTGNYLGLGIGNQQKPARLEWYRQEIFTESHSAQTEKTTIDSTSYQGVLSFANLGSLLSEWGYEPIVTTKSGVLDVDVSWPGSPDAFRLAAATGQFAINFRDGVFKKASSGAKNALAVVSILDLTNVVTRLRFDVTDMFESGIPFDSIDGQFNVANTELKFLQPLDIQGPSSRFKADGSADLEAETLDIELIATLPIGSNLPWLAALAGGLPAAAGVFVVSKIFEEQVDKLSSAVYGISGDWNDPEVKFRRIFDDTANVKATKKEKKKAASKSTDNVEQTESANGIAPEARE